MKRAIKFRGQRVDNGKWVYGAFYPINGEDVCFIINNCQSLYFEDNDTVFDGHKVHRETVGQFTGHHDKNGKEIYEGDIVEYDDTPYNAYARKRTGIIRWFKSKWVHEYDSGFKEEHGNKYFFQYPLGSEDFFGAKSIIIGNIHTTPELLNPLNQ